MLNEIQEAFGELEKVKQEWHEELRTLSNEQLNQRAGDKQWSPLQNVEHLIIAEGLGVKYIRKKLQYADKAKKSGWANRMRAQLLTFLTKNRLFKYKAPKILSEPAYPSEIENVFGRWTGIRQEMAAELEKINDAQVNKELFKHPIAGRMNIISALGFMTAHVSRHRTQVRKSLEKMAR